MQTFHPGCRGLIGEEDHADQATAQASLGIDSLGYEPFQKDLYTKYLAKPQGMILVTGPTGSGKTVSLYTGLPLSLGINAGSSMLFFLSLFVIILSLSTGKTTILQGIVLLIIFAVYIFVIIFP
jgi:type IV secretory pathway ATPase VirB11/archaellum biosynthesis ATPase